MPGFTAPITADELAGLALEPYVESRIIERDGGEYRLHHGPFDEAAFNRQLPWTLLVQAVDHWLPEVAALRQLVSFLPGWRIDDVMVSYAGDGGSVGPHYDNYDVFLLQGEGCRRWRVGQWCGEDEPLVPHGELRILARFEEQADYLLEPGDILYLPPRVAHWGIAEGECTTFSIGFRAPRINDMVSRWADDALAQIEPALFYTDPSSEPVTRAGEIRRPDRGHRAKGRCTARCAHGRPGQRAARRRPHAGNRTRPCPACLAGGRQRAAGVCQRREHGCESRCLACAD